MLYRIASRFVVVLILGSLSALGQTAAPQPIIESLSVPAQARIMQGPIRIQVAAAAEQGETRSLTYNWTITENPTGAAVLSATNRSSVYVSVFSGVPSTKGVGQNLKVQVEVAYTPVQEGDVPAVAQGEIYLSALNRPPVPVISGSLGTSTNRIPAGRSVCAGSSSSSDPDGDRFQSLWALGASRLGRYEGSPVLFGSEGTQVCFTVPDMTGVIDQDIVLTLKEGLYEVNGTATVYLAPATASANVAPTVTLNSTSVVVAQGQPAVFQAVGADSNGDNLSFTWLFNSGTASGASIQSVRSSSTTWTSTMTLPTSALSPGSYSISVQAAETNTSDRRTSTTRFGTLVVNTNGGGGVPGYFNAVQGQCSSNSGPGLVSISPDPRSSQILLTAGQSPTVELIFQDNSTQNSPLGGTITGVSEISWGLAGLSQKGISAVGSPAQAVSDPQKARTVLTFSVPSGVTGESRVTATASDVLGCSTTVEFGINFAGGTTNNPPSAKIRYDVTGTGNMNGPVASGTTVQTSRKSIPLDALASTDDGGSMTYAWSVSGLSGASVSPTTGAQTTLSIPQSATSGTATVTLTATDSGSLTSQSTLLFSVSAAANEAPVSRIRYSVAGGPLTGPLASGASVSPTTRTISLDGGASSDDITTALIYSWSVSGISGATLSSFSGNQTTLTVPDGQTGTAVVTLTVTDGGGLSGSSTLQFSYSAPPVAKIRYDLQAGGGWVGPADSGQVVSTGQHSIKLDASQSTDDGGQQALVYTWYANGIAGASLSSANGAAPTLTIPAEASGTISVTLTATDTGGQSASAVISFLIGGGGGGQNPVAKILYDEQGTGTFTGPFSSGHVVTTTHRSIVLDGSASTDDEDTGNLSYVWSVSGKGASLSAATSAQTTLTVPAGLQGTVTVLLNVLDSDSLSGSTTIAFSYASAASAPTAQILAPPDYVVSGDEVEIEGQGSGGDGRGEKSYDWTISCCGNEGDPVDSYSGGAKVRFVVPPLEAGQEEGVIKLQLVVRQDGLASEPAAVEVPVHRPQLFFAQMAVGNFTINKTPLRYETSIVLVNNSESAVDGVMTFLNNELGESWNVLIDNESVSEKSFTLDPGGAREFVMKGTNVETGWMKLSASNQLTGHLFYRVVKTGATTADEEIVAEVPILPVTGKTFRTALGPGANENIAIALVNLTDRPATFTITITKSGGAVEGKTIDLHLEANEHMARFLNEILTDGDVRPLWPGFRGGTLIIEATSENAFFVATVMKTNKDGLPMSILPVAVSK